MSAVLVLVYAAAVVALVAMAVTGQTATVSFIAAFGVASLAAWGLVRRGLRWAKGGWIALVLVLAAVLIRTYVVAFQAV